MPTARSWPDAARASADVGALLRFRLAALRGRSRRGALIAVGVLVSITLCAAVVPAFVDPGRWTRSGTRDLLPALLVGLLAIALASAAASGGGRELLARDQAVAFPVSPTTDHLGALVMAPLNVAWLAQTWTVLAAVAYVVGPRPALVAAQVLMLVWVAVATSVAQAVAWGLEWVRRGAHGTAAVRLLGLGVVALCGVLALTDRVATVLAHSPAVPVAQGVDDLRAGRLSSYAMVLALLLLAGLAAVAVGAWAAGRLVRRPAREELRGETAVRPARPNPASDLVAMMRVDRAAVWRSVPMRRGLGVLAVLPGAIALGGSFSWGNLAILPGLVCAGGALLFGVNSWCLDGRGALWRDSLPVRPSLVLTSRVLVLSEILLASSAVTLVLAAVRAGRPTPAQLVAVVCASLVVTLQVVATSLRWSVRRPFAVDLKSPRATPAPPMVMVGYSARFAFAATLTGMLFDSAGYGAWWVPPLLALPFLAWSGTKLALVARAWSDPTTRARVVATVAS